MPKAARKKFYAVLNGRGGPKVYDCWTECQAATVRFSGASSKSFCTYEDAQDWLVKSGLSRYRQHSTTMSKEAKVVPQRRPKAPKSKVITPPNRYPNSSKFWVDYVPAYVDAGVQCSDVMQPSTVDRTLQEAASRAAVFQFVPERKAMVSKPLPDITQNAPDIELSAEQKHVLKLVKSGENVFFTGPAGTGKSVLLREIIRQLKRTITKTTVAITATTGIAGLNIGGSTVHSFAGIGLGKEPAEKLANKIKISRRLCERWKSTEILVVDEISMMDANLFDKLEFIARRVRNCTKPFGGIQLVLSGDFFQLPPIPDQSYEYKMAATYAFDAKSWPRCISKPIFLNQVFRQKDDTFIDILASMRTGVLTSSHIEQLQRLSRPLHYADGIEPSQLFPLRREVESCNNSRLNALDSPEHVYRSTDSAGYDVRRQPISEDNANILLDRLVAASTIALKVGAQVMLIQNIEQGVLVNGSVGKVVEFLTTHEALERHIAIATLSEPPDHRSRLEDWDPEMTLRPISDNVFDRKERWPMVRFTNDRELLCAPLAFTVEGFMGNIEAHRLQVPLILAWALSIHKSQGQTLTRVKVDLGHVFEKGQAYVALSRATTLENLELQNFQPSKVMAHPRVIAWQAFWTSYGQADPSHDEMDTEETISLFFDSSDFLEIAGQ